MRDLSLHILDIVQNSITAQATKIKIHISIDSQRDYLLLNVSDNGAGMDSDLLLKAQDPFFTSRITRKVGFGIPLLIESAKKCNGNFNIISEKNEGTHIIAEFSINHIDRLPIGEIGETLVAAISSNPQISFILELNSGKGFFRLDTDEVAKTLGNVSITVFAVLKWLKEYIDEGIKNIFGGVLNEVDS
ncbi:ATP-binding protein [Ruminiclostridium cellulolyticum]|uniref:Histidine kinase n=1 Tax=Ruminiclostridium cellulolyticum (strain ATCC 35319 / DSM 5812 / JCM 6584 / H10) TaxID=394503 RepID=B8I4S3_RUMCH|nr:ATP-binding protein [Ruminiclostridium cellulolyticum]ACL76577.1 histidine kinase [Ruminiclostridium cellulolyticum H10]